MPRKKAAPAPEPTPEPTPPTIEGEGVGTQGATLSAIEKDLAEWGINPADLDPDAAEARAEAEAALNDESIPDGHSVDPFDGDPEASKLVEPKPEDLADLDLGDDGGVAGEGEDSDEPPNKGVPPMHELLKRGLVPDEVVAHVKAYRKGFTQAQQEAAALRKELESLRAQQDDPDNGPPLAPPTGPFGEVNPTFAESIRNLAATEVDPASVFTAEGAALAAKVEAAKLLLPQIEYAQKEAEARREAQAQQEAKRSAKAWIKENAWVMQPGIKEATAEYIKAGMDLESAAWRAYGEHQMKAKTAPAPTQEGSAQRDADEDTSPTRERRGGGRRRRPWEISAVEIYQEEMRRSRSGGK